MNTPEQLPLHPWYNDTSRSGSFKDIEGKGTLWHYGANHTADCIIFAGDTVALITRHDNNKLALPGGFVDLGEAALTTALREAHEETGLTLVSSYAVQIYTGPVADERATRHAWPHTTAFRFDVPHAVELTPGDDAARADWYPLDSLEEHTLHGSHFALISAARADQQNS